MADLGTVVDKTTLIPAAWVQDVNDFVYRASVKLFGVNEPAADLANLTAAIASAPSGAVLELFGTFKLNTTIIIEKPLTLKLSPTTVLDFSSLPAGTVLGQTSGIIFRGTTLGSNLTLSSNLNEKSTQVVVSSTSTLAANDWVMLRSNDLYAAGAAPGLATLGHFARIRTIDSGTNLTLYTRSPFTYNTANNARLTKLALLGGAKIEGGQIVMGGVGSAHTGVRFEYCLNPRIEQTQISGGEDTGVTFALCVNPVAYLVTILNSTSPGGSIGNTGYGIANYSCEAGAVIGGYFFNCRHSVSGGASAGFVIPKSFNVTKTYSFACGLNTWALDCHEPCFEWIFEGNVTEGGAGGLVIRGPGTKAHNNLIRHPAGSGIYIGQFNNNTSGLPDVDVSNNEIIGAGTYGIHFVGNTVPGDLVHTSLVKNNTVRDSSLHAVLVQYASGIDLSGTIVSGVGGTFQMGIYLQNSNKVTISSGVLEMTAAGNGNAVFVENTSRVRLSNLIMTGNASASTQDAIRANASSAQQGLTVVACDAVNFGRYALHTTNTDRVIATNNDFRDVVSATKILISGATTSVNTNNIV